MMVKRFYFFFFIFLAACFPSRDISNKNMVSMYRKEEMLFHPELRAFILNDSTVTLLAKIKIDELLFVRQANNSFQSTVHLVGEIIRSYDDVRLIDSASADYKFDITEKSYTRLMRLNIPLREKAEQLIHVQVVDANKGFHEDFFVPLDYTSKSSRNAFLVNDSTGPLFRDYIDADERFSIAYTDTTIKSVFCKYYKREFPLPPPPFGFNVHDDFNYHADSIFSVPVNQHVFLQLPKEGFYHLQIDTSKREGLTLFRFSADYPSIVSAQQMVDPVRYLTNRKEFEELKAKPSAKAAVDEFWLIRGNRNEEKTRTLIKKFYGRVQEANRMFSSYVEGWRTDRGMIYVIFGSPTTVFKSANSETWIYGTTNSPLAINFFFMKVENPFTMNDYLLSRAPIYEASWYRAVEIWRQGRPYNSFY